MESMYLRRLILVGVHRAPHYGKWSCVKNPYTDPGYAVPYGFVQSPILASLVLAHSEVGQTLSRLANHVTVTVYVDDISLSSNDLPLLREKFKELLHAVGASGFKSNEVKAVPPTRSMTVFNCDLRQGETNVTPRLITEFYDQGPTADSAVGFERYCLSINRGNVRKFQTL